VSSARPSQAASIVDWRLFIGYGREDAGKHAFYLLCPGATRAEAVLARGLPARHPAYGGPLHRLEQMGEGATDGELLGASLEDDERLIAVIALDPCDRTQVDDGAAVHLPEQLRIELVE